MKKNFLVFGKTNLIATKTISLLKKNNFIKSYSSKECNLLNKKDTIHEKYSSNVIIFRSVTSNPCQNSQKSLRNMTWCFFLFCKWRHQEALYRTYKKGINLNFLAKVSQVTSYKKN